MKESLIILSIFVPLLGSVTLPLIGKYSVTARNAMAFVYVAAAFCLSAAMLPAVLNDGNILVTFAMPLGLGFGFQADALALFMALAASFVAAVIVVYSLGYIKHYDNQNEYFFMVVLFIGAMMGLVYSTNLIFLYVFWEISALCCWRLIGFYREDITVVRANKAFLVTVFGAMVMLLGFLSIYGQTGTFDLLQMEGMRIPDLAVWLILAGILSKSATFPLHSWLPDAGVAPSPVTSLLHAAVLVKIGVYAYTRLFVVTFDISDAFTAIVPTIAGISALISAGCALKATDIKRVIAYSTISQLAFILLGLSSGTEVGVVGGLLYILAHSVAKGGLFLAAGVVEHALHTKDMTQMGGLYKRFPLTAVAFALCAFSVMGIPPFSGFFAKYMVIEGIFQSGQIGLGMVFIAGAVMTVMYLVRAFVMVFLGPCKCPEAQEGDRIMVTCVMILAVVALVLGLCIAWPSGLAAMVGEVM